MKMKMRKNDEVQQRACSALLCALFLVALLTTTGDALSAKGRSNKETSKIVVTDVGPTITSVSPLVVSLNDRPNITVGFTGGSFSCAVCGFNITVSQNVTTNPTYSDFRTVICPFPNQGYILQGIVSVWVQECNNPLIATNAYPLYAYYVSPYIESVSPETLIATGGYNATITVLNPLPAFQLNFPVYCNLSGSIQFAIQTSNPGVFICPFSVVPIGPGTLSLYWQSYVYPYSRLYTNARPVVIRSNRILSIYPTSVCVLGGTNITLNMEYPVGSGAACMFSTLNEGYYQAVESLEAIPSGNSYICPALPWSVSNGLNAAISLVIPGSEDLLTNPVEINYYTECALSVNPTTVCSIGSAPVTVYGRGFPPAGSPYSSMEALFWPTPQIGQYFYHVSTVTPNTTTQISFIPAINLYNLEQYYVQIMSTYNFNLNVTSLPLIEMKNTNSCLTSVSPSVLNYDGGDLVTVRTLIPTFSTNYGPNSYLCVFVDPSEIRTFSTANYVSPIELTCVSPPVTSPGTGTIAVQFAPAPAYKYKTDPLTVKWVRKSS
eukprot:TRINITY_DN2090_c0_g1_i1.p1 TRINITY_DN2090_c0_g1~~TRINITY_DN2090_c0_g1_i1.p1  ORF type:complete len:578 (+),score=70.60 TRINITY_DN2090_c0_g1_i1:92-1735(+)